MGAGGGGAEEVEALKRAGEEARVQAVRLEEEMLAFRVVGVDVVPNS